MQTISSFFPPLAKISNLLSERKFSDFREMLNLLEMPDVAMNMILEKLDYIDVQRLRKTCWTIRNFIDDSNFDSCLTRIDIQISDYINFTFGDDDEKIQIQYKKCDNNGCEIVIYENYKNRQKVLENQDFVDLAFRDFQSILSFQKSILHFLNIDFCSKTGSSNIPERFQNILKFRKIKTKTFRTTVTREFEILSILPFLDSTHLKSLIIFNGQGDIINELETSEFVESEQWKNLETLTIRNFVVDIPIQNLKHLKRIYVAFEEITMDIVMELKEAFLTSESLQEFKIDFDSQKIEQNLAEVFGEPITDHDGFGQERKKWFFEIPNFENRVLLISLNLYCIIFYRNWTENVPENVVMN